MGSHAIVPSICRLLSRVYHTATTQLCQQQQRWLGKRWVLPHWGYVPFTEQTEHVLLSCCFHNQKTIWSSIFLCPFPIQLSVTRNITRRFSMCDKRRKTKQSLIIIVYTQTYSHTLKSLHIVYLSIFYIYHHVAIASSFAALAYAPIPHVRPNRSGLIWHHFQKIIIKNSHHYFLLSEKKIFKKRSVMWGNC